MFDDLKKDASVTNMPSPEVEMNQSKKMDDMFADTDPIADRSSAVQAGKITPVNKSSLTSSPEVKQTSNQILVDDMKVTEAKHGHNGLKTMIIIIVVLIILGVIGWVAYNFFLNNRIEPVDVNLNTNTNTNVNTNVNLNTNTNTNVNTNVNDLPPVLTDEDLDDDSDGLSNAEEKRLGTNVNNPDTDNDGLFDQDETELYQTNPLLTDTDSDGLSDYNEIRVWKTNPNEEDTDADGYFDGIEVDNGYNPLGEGTIDEWAPPLQDLIN